MLYKFVVTVVVAAFAAQAAFAGTCTESTRNSTAKRADVNIKVKNDTNETIEVSIWKGTSTERKTIFADDVSVSSDGKVGKTDKSVGDADFYFTARRKESTTETMCSFNAYMTKISGMIGGKEFRANIDFFECSDADDLTVTCEKSFDANKDRWNVQYAVQ